MEAVMKMQSTFDKIRQKGRTVPWGRVLIAMACVFFCAGLITGGVVYIISLEEGVNEFFPGLGSGDTNAPFISTTTAVVMSPPPVDTPKTRQAVKHSHDSKEKEKHAREKRGGGQHAHTDGKTDHNALSPEKHKNRRSLRRPDS